MFVKEKKKKKGVSRRNLNLQRFFSFLSQRAHQRSLHLKKIEGERRARERSAKKNRKNKGTFLYWHTFCTKKKGSSLLLLCEASSFSDTIFLLSNCLCYIHFQTKSFNLPSSSIYLKFIIYLKSVYLIWTLTTFI